MISNCGKDERGKYAGGKAGDQGGEWVIKSWYNRPWNVVMRHPDEKVRKVISEMATAAANNNHIGYDQTQRLTFWTQLAKVGYKPELIKTDCEADCSSGVAAIVKGAGYRLKDARMQKLPVTCWTGNLRSQLVLVGFKTLTDEKYLKSDSYLYAGDILLNEQHHVCTNVTDGAKVKKPEPKPEPKPQPQPKKAISQIAAEVIAGKWGSGSERMKRLREAGYSYDEVQKEVNAQLAAKSGKAQYKVTAHDGLNIRKGAGTAYAKVGALGYGAKVTVTEQKNGWGYIGSGWVSMYYLTRI